MLLVPVLVLRPKLLEKCQVLSSTKKYIVFNQKLYTEYIDSSEFCDDTIG